MSKGRITTAESALQTANSLFVDENFEEALAHYTEALELDNTNAESFIKRSICFHKLDKYTESLNDANSALKLHPDNSKAYLRKGMALFSLDEYETAKVAFDKGQSLDPNNSQFRTWIRKCQAELEVDGNAEQQTTVVDEKFTTEPVPTPMQTESNTVPKNVTPAPVVPSKPEPKFKHEWYQTTTHVVITILAKAIAKENVNVQFQERSVSVTIKISENNDYLLDLDLFEKIVPTESVTSILTTKIEIKMKKASGIRWNTLEDTGEKKVAQFEPPTTSAVKQKKNWDKIVDDETKNDKPEGEEALNKVFQDIFSNGTDEQKRAMMKSFTESGGTVLSTNWDEVGKAPVKGSPPEGLEMHKWDESTKNH